MITSHSPIHLNRRERTCYVISKEYRNKGRPIAASGDTPLLLSFVEIAEEHKCGS